MNNMTLRDLVKRTRCYRRFDEQHVVSKADLLDLIDLARLTSSAKNMQPLRYVVSCSATGNKLIFETLSWAGYLPDWPGPVEGERPSAYLVQLLDTLITTDNYCDHGLAAQSILLGATEKGLGGCVIAAIDKHRLSKALNLPPNLVILQVIAIGRPIETIVLDELQPGQSHKYWRDENNVHHVPKRKLDDLIIDVL